MKQTQFYPTTSELPLLLDGRQNALVRPMVPQPGEDAHIVKIVDRPGQYVDIRDSDFFDGKKEVLTRWNCPFGAPETELWCKEPRLSIEWGHPYVGDSTPTMKPAICMPKSACRLWLQVLEVKACRVHDVTEEMAMAAGFTADGNGYPWDQDARHNLHMEIDMKIGPDKWTENPWVWYATGKRIEKP